MSIDMRLDGDDAWKVEWVRIDDGLESPFRIECQRTLDDWATVHCSRYVTQQNNALQGP